MRGGGRGGGGSGAPHEVSWGGTVRTTLLEVPNLRWGFLARGVGVFSASEDKPQPICAVRSQQES